MIGPDGAAPWRVAVTRAFDQSDVRDLAERGFAVAAVPVLVEGPPPDAARLTAMARTLDQFDWVMCASVRAVRALTDARGGTWPTTVKTAAVGHVTAVAILDAGGARPLVGDSQTASGLWTRLRHEDDWRQRKVLVTTVADGRRELIDALCAAGATVTEVEAYSMVPNPPGQIRRDWQHADPHAVIIGSASTARHLADAVGAAALATLEAVVAIGPTTAAALAERKIPSTMPAHATFAAAVNHLISLPFWHRRRP